MIDKVDTTKSSCYFKFKLIIDWSRWINRVFDIYWNRECSIWEFKRNKKVENKLMLKGDKYEEELYFVNVI